MELVFLSVLVVVTLTYLVSWRSENKVATHWMSKYIELLRKNRDLTEQLESLKPKRRSKKDE